MFGYQIHPDIIGTLPASPRIADVGTATGDYLVRLTQSFPKEARFDGFDISSGCFPVRDQHPENVRLHVHDVRLPFPAEHHGQYDFVHLRLIILGMEKDDWAVATRNLVQLLKPGGAIQWEESDTTRMRCVRGTPGTKCRGLKTLFDLVFEMSRAQFTVDATTILPEIFKAAGLLAVDQDAVACDRIPEDRKKFGTGLIEGTKIFLTAAGKGANVGSGETLDGLVQTAYEDVENGAYWRIDTYATIGFKPK